MTNKLCVLHHIFIRNECEKRIVRDIFVIEDNQSIKFNSSLGHIYMFIYINKHVYIYIWLINYVCYIIYLFELNVNKDTVFARLVVRDYIFGIEYDQSIKFIYISSVGHIYIYIYIYIYMCTYLSVLNTYSE